MNGQAVSGLKKFLMKAAICCAGYGIMSDMTIVPLVNALFGEGGTFAGDALFWQNYVLSGCNLAGLLGIFLTGFLIKRVNGKKLLLFGTGLFFLSGTACAFSTSIYMLCFFRTLDCLSDGILTVVTSAMIMNLWESEREQGQMFGWYNILSSVFGITVTVLGGYAAVISWRLGFLVNGISLISVLLVVFFVPADGMLKEAPESGEKTEGAAAPQKFRPLSFALTMLGAMLINTVVILFSLLMDVYIAEKGFGNSVVTGYLNALTLGIGMVSCYIATPVLEKIKNKNLFACVFFLCCGIAYILYDRAFSVWMLVFAVLFGGLFSSWPIIFYNLYISRTVPVAHRGICLSAYNIIIYAAGFAAPYIPYLNLCLTGNGGMSAACALCGKMLFVPAFIYLVLALAKRKTPEDY